ncbi:MAG TPA: hypothetical protein VNW71_02935 [Thermoanaerobaculia bacterium]|nr:hypothetical protein [Thermoanaerobaculia bacterium]
MADLEVFFMHPTRDTRTRARVDDSMTPQEVIADLTREGFLENRSEYDLAIKGGPLIGGSETLRAAGVQNGATLRVLTRTTAGTRSGGK